MCSHAGLGLATAANMLRPLPTPTHAHSSTHGAATQLIKLQVNASGTNVQLSQIVQLAMIPTARVVPQGLAAPCAHPILLPTRTAFPACIPQHNGDHNDKIFIENISVPF